MTGGPTPATVRRPGRPRDERAADGILDAAVEVLATQGPAGFTVEAVAARAGVGKATIYRRWPSRAALMLETAHRRLGLEVDDPDTGSLADDLATILMTLGRKLRETPAGRVLPVVMAEAAINPEMRPILARFVADRRRLPRIVVERGVVRGELPPSTDIDLALDLLGGAVFFRALLSDAPVDDAATRAMVDLVLVGLRGAADRTGC